MGKIVILSAPLTTLPPASLEGMASAPIGPNGSIVNNTNAITSIAPFIGWQTVIPTAAVPAPPQIAGLVPLIPCDYSDCRTGSQDGCFMIPAFGNPSDTASTYKNDVNYFFIDAANTTYLPTFYLQKAQNYYMSNEPSAWNIVAVLNASVYGTFYPIGSIPGNPTWTGFIINWGKVVAAFGNGVYQIALGSCASCEEGTQPNFTFANIGTLGFTTGVLTIKIKIGNATFTATYNSVGPTNNITNINNIGNYLAAFLNSTNLVTSTYTAAGENLYVQGTQYNTQNGVVISLTFSGACETTEPLSNTFEGGNCVCDGEATLNCIITSWTGSQLVTGKIILGAITLTISFSGTFTNFLTYIAALINANRRYKATVIMNGIEITGTQCESDNGTVISAVLNVGNSSSGVVTTYTYSFGILTGATLPTVMCNCISATPPFQLWQWDCNKADHTVKFEIEMAGVKGSATVMGFLQYFNGWTLNDSVRLPHSYFGNKKLSYDEVYLEYGIDNTQPFGDIEQVRNKAVPGYIFEGGYFPQWLLEPLGVYMMMADNILVSDYNSNNSDYFIQQKKVIKKKGAAWTPEYRDGERFDAGLQFIQRTGKPKVEFEEGIQSIISSPC